MAELENNAKNLFTKEAAHNEQAATDLGHIALETTTEEVEYFSPTPGPLTTEQELGLTYELPAYKPEPEVE